jgi:hypothetical protein
MYSKSKEVCPFAYLSSFQYWLVKLFRSCISVLGCYMIDLMVVAGADNLCLDEWHDRTECVPPTQPSDPQVNCSVRSDLYSYFRGSCQFCIFYLESKEVEFWYALNIFFVYVLGCITLYRFMFIYIYIYIYIYIFAYLFTVLIFCFETVGIWG